MSSESWFPEPKVTRVTFNGKTSDINIQFAANVERHDQRIVELKSVDEGLNWVESSAHPEEAGQIVRYGSLAYREYSASFDPSSNLVSRGILDRSRDGGVHWERPLFRINGQPQQIDNGGNDRSPTSITFNFGAANPQEPTSIYGCFHLTRPSPQHGSNQSSFVPGLYVSTDAGDNWSLLSNDVQGESRLTEGCPLGISSLNSATMIAHGRSGVILSHDGGKHWDPVGEASYLEQPAPLEGYADGLAKTEKKGVIVENKWPFDWTYLIIKKIAFLPRSDEIAFLLTNKGLYRTDDRAKSWRLLDTGLHKLFDLRNLYIEPAPEGRIYIGTTEKILASDDLGCKFRVLFDSTSYSNNDRRRVGHH